MMIYLKTKWNANTRAENKEISNETNESLSANHTSINIEANRGGTGDMRMELIANVSNDGVQKKTIVSRRMVEAYEELDLTLTFVTESYPPVSNQRWIKATKVKTGTNTTMHQESYSVEDLRFEKTSCVSSNLVKM